MSFFGGRPFPPHRRVIKQLPVLEYACMGHGDFLERRGAWSYPCIIANGSALHVCMNVQHGGNRRGQRALQLYVRSHVFVPQARESGPGNMLHVHCPLCYVRVDPSYRLSKYRNWPGSEGISLLGKKFKNIYF